MTNVAFRQIPALKAVFKVTEDCCFEKVVYDGPEIGITAKIDRNNEFVGVLLCYCDPKIEILPISEAAYYSYYFNVNNRRKVS